jgi:alcohol dehydrogenase
MKVMVLTKPHEMRIEERPYPRLDPGEVIVKIDASGICGSDLHGYLGHDPTRAPGMILGHEIAGRIVASSVPQYAEGTLVTSNSAMSCGRCEYCYQGRDNLCEQRKSLGKHRQGGYAEYVAIPARALIDVPQDIDPVRAALTEPVAVGLHAINLARKSLLRPLAECKALVIGGGAIGFLAAAGLKAYGCRDLVLAEPNPQRRKTAGKYIGCGTLDPRERAAEADAFDLVIDAVGSQASIGAAMKAARRGGVISEVGLHDHDLTIDLQKLVRTQVTLVGAANYPTTELRAAVKLLTSGMLGDLSFIELRPLEDGPRSFAEMADGKVATPKIILLPARTA